MRFKLQTCMVALASSKYSSAFLLMNTLVAYERFDPIVQPGVVSGHLHAVTGASSFGQTFDPAVWNTAKCSTAQIQENKSNYWMPSMMARHDNGSFSALPLREARVYYMLNHPDGTKLTAFPQGLRILAGNPSATSPIANDPGNIGYRCQNGGSAEGHENHLQNIPDFTCKDFMRAELQFPDCWNGKDLDSTDHKSHMAYRSGSKCPPTHPVPVAQVVLELGWRTKDYRPDQLVLSTGDQRGFGLHADYLSFWDVDLLQRALDDPTCQDRENIFGDAAQCATLKPHRNDAAMESCVLEANIPQEQVGIAVPVPTLPGCNPLWNSSIGQTKPPCNPAPPTPEIGKANGIYNFNMYNNPNLRPRVDIPVYWGFNTALATTSTNSIPTTLATSTKTVPPTATASSVTWNSIGCYTDDTVSRILQVSGSTSTSLTIPTCQARCHTLGYAYSGVEFGTECWCGSGLNAAQTKVSDSDCSMACSGNSATKCGGRNRINVYKSSAPSWKSLGCYTDAVSSRALPVTGQVNGGMTPERCRTSCGGLGYKFAGVEYASECWCGNSITTPQTKVNDADCNMSCIGSTSEKCGNAYRVYVYQFA